MKKYKQIAIISMSIIAIFYTIWLLILPIAVNLSFAKDMAQSIVREQTGLNLSIDKIKLLTGFPLKVGLSLTDANLTCANEDNIGSVEKISVKLNILPLIFGKIKIDNIDIETLTAGTQIDKNGHLIVEKCLVFPQEQTTKTNDSTNFSLDKKLPNIKIKNLTLNLKDLETSNTLSLQLANLLISKFILDEHIAINTQGKILLNETANINFDIQTDSFLPKITMPEPATEQKTNTPYFNFIKEFANYNLLADIKSDLKITQKNKDIYADGVFDIDGLSFKIENKQLPASYLHTIFEKEKGKLESRIFISEEENFALNGQLIAGNKPELNLEFITDKISFDNIKKIALAALNSLAINNNIQSLQTNGYIISNLKVNTNFNKFNSTGSFRIADGEIISDKHNLFIKKINSNLNFAENELKISNTSALINDALLELKGSINSDAIADVTLFTNKLPLAKLANSFLPNDLKNSYEITSGILDLNLLLQGKLESIKPSANLNLTNLKITDKINKINLQNALTQINLNTDGKTFSGNITLKDSYGFFTNLNSKITMPMLTANITPTQIILNKSDILFNSSKATIEGVIENYLSSADMNFTIDGKINTSDIKNLFPKELANEIKAQGIIPIKAKFNGTNIFTITAQTFADKNNFIDIVNIDKLTNQPSILNANIQLDKNNIIINDIGLYAAKTDIFTDDFSKNLQNSKQLIGILGNIINFEKFQNLKIFTKENLGINIFNIFTNLNAEIIANGNLNSPEIKGNINLGQLNAPDYLIKGQIANIILSNKEISADILGLNLNDSVIDAKFNAKNSFNLPFVINSMELNSDSIDLDKVIIITTKFPQGTSAPTNAPMIPVTIKSGNAKVGYFKVGTLSANNITTPLILSNDILKMNGLKGTAFSGELNGDVSYDLKKLLLQANLNGQNMEANPAVSALIGIKDQIKGTLDFDANISMKGATMEEQLQTLNGTANFEVTDGQLGSLGRIETYLMAANIVSSKFIQSSINNIINTVLPYNSGQVAKAQGKLSFSKGNVYFKPIISTGKEMSLYVDGYLNMLNYNGDIKILGKLNQEIVNILGPITNLSVENILSYIPKIGNNASILFQSLNTPIDSNELKNIPSLTPEANNKAFKVLIKGNTMSAGAIKSFQWLSSEEDINSTENSLEPTSQPTSKEAYEQLKTTVQQQTEQKINEAIENNETLKKIKNFSDFLKNSNTQN